MKLIEYKLDDIAYIIAGQSPDSKYYNKNKEGYPFLQGKTDFGMKYPSFSSWCTEAKRLAQNKDILLSVRAPVGSVNIAQEEICIGRGIAALRAKENISYEYLYYFLKLNQHYFKSFETGTTFKAITVQNIKKIPVKIPKRLEDQKKIANLLSQIETLISKREKTIELLDELVKSTFLDMFGDPVINEKGWKKTICIEESGCIVPGRDKPKSFTGTTKWITTNDLNDKGILETKKVEIGLSFKEITEVRAKIIPKDSVIFTCVGELGLVSIIDNDIVMNQQLHSFQCRENLNNIFLMFNISFQKPYMYKKASKTTVPYMNKNTCNNIPLILPPKDLQDEFANIAKKIESTKKTYQKNLDELNQLFGSVSQKAFKDELNLSKFKSIEIESKESKKAEIDKERNKWSEKQDQDVFEKSKSLQVRDNINNSETIVLQVDEKTLKRLVKAAAGEGNTFENIFNNLRSGPQKKELPYDGKDNKQKNELSLKEIIFKLLENGELIQEFDKSKEKIVLKSV